MKDPVIDLLVLASRTAAEDPTAITTNGVFGFLVQTIAGVVGVGVGMVHLDETVVWVLVHHETERERRRAALYDEVKDGLRDGWLAARLASATERQG